MKIINNQSLEYTKSPSCCFNGPEKWEADINKMYLLSVKRHNEKMLLLKLKAEEVECDASIRAKDNKGVKYLDSIKNKLENNFIGHSYKEILDSDFN